MSGPEKVNEKEKCEKSENNENKGVTAPTIAGLITGALAFVAALAWNDAIQKGIKRCAETIENVEGAWVKEQKVVVKDGQVSEYRVTMKLSFVLKD